MLEINQELIQKYFIYSNGNLYRKTKIGKQTKVGKKVGNPCKNGYLQMSFLYKKYYVHRMIWFYHYGTFPKQIDHINRDRSDNRIENLRECTQSQNLMNTGIGKRNKSGVKGLSWCKTHKRWRVCLTLNKKVKTIGYFKDKEFAELVAYEAFDKYYKEYNGYN